MRALRAQSPPPPLSKLCTPLIVVCVNNNIVCVCVCDMHNIVCVHIINSVCTCMHVCGQYIINSATAVKRFDLYC